MISEFWKISVGKEITEFIRLFVDGHELESWDTKFSQLSNNLDILTSVSAEGRKLVEKSHDLNDFVSTLSNYLVEIEL